MSEKNEARLMAEFIEKWLGNSLIRKILGFLTKRCPKDGRRAEIALEMYATGKKRKLCLSCRFSAFLISKFLDSIIKRLDTSKEDVKTQLNDPMWRKGLSSVLEGIAKYGPTKPFTAYAPFLVVWNFTKACNLHCRHCYEVADKPAADELTTAEALDAVDKMAQAGVAYIAISGGEPFVRKDLFQIVERIRHHGMGFSIATNGTLLTKENVEKLKQYNCLFVQVSLDGATPESHNWFRGQNMFEKTIEGIKNAVDAGLSVGIATTVTNHNYNEVQDIINLAEKLGVGTFMHYNFVPTGRGKDIIKLDITPEQREEMLKMMAKQTGRKIRVLSTAPQFARVCVQNEAMSFPMTHFDYTSGEYSKSIKFLADFVGGCGTGRLYCALEPNGDIIPCVFIPIKLGNIKNDDFLKIWHESDVFNKIRKRDEFGGSCGSCDYRNICGGCRARAYAYFDDIQGPDPGCINNKELFDEIKNCANCQNCSSCQ